MQPPGRALAGLTTTTAARKAIIGNQFFMQTSFREFINNSSVPWFQVTNKIDDRLVASRAASKKPATIAKAASDKQHNCSRWPHRMLPAQVGKTARRGAG
jgi:hypothetical protein